MRIPVRDFNHQLRRLSATKFFNSSIWWKSRRYLVTKPYGAYTQQLLQEIDELGQELCLWSQFAWIEFAQSFCNLCTVWRPIKKSFYMSRVRRKEGPKTYSWILRKSYLNFEILKPRQIGGVEQLSRFNEFVLSACFLGQTWRLQHLILTRGFLKYLNIS